MYEYEVGDVVEALPNTFVKTGTRGVVKRIDRYYVGVEFVMGDISPDTPRAYFLMVPREIRKVVPDAV